MASKPPAGRPGDPCRNGSQASLSRHLSSFGDAKSRIGSGASPCRKSSAASSKENFIPGTGQPMSPARKLDIDAPKLQIANREPSFSRQLDFKAPVQGKRSTSQSLLANSNKCGIQGEEDDEAILQQRSSSFQLKVACLKNLSHPVRQQEDDMWLLPSSVASKREEQLELEMEVLKARIRCLEHAASMSNNATIEMQGTEIAKLVTELRLAKERSFEDAISLVKLSEEVTQLQKQLLTKDSALQIAEANGQADHKTFCEFEAQLLAKDEEIAGLRNCLKHEEHRVEQALQEALDAKEALAELEEQLQAKDAEHLSIRNNSKGAVDEDADLSQPAEDVNHLEVLLGEKENEISHLKSTLEKERMQGLEDERQWQRTVRNFETQIKEKVANIQKLDAALAEYQVHKGQLLTEVDRLQTRCSQLELQVQGKDFELMQLHADADRELREQEGCRNQRHSMNEMEREGPRRDSEIMKLKDILAEERLQALEDMQQLQERINVLEKMLRDKEMMLLEANSLKDDFQGCPSKVPDQLVAKLEQVIAEKESDIQSLEQDREEMAEEIIGLQEKICSLEAGLEDQKEAVQKMSQLLEKQKSCNTDGAPDSQQLQRQALQYEAAITQLHQREQHFREMDMRQQEQIQWHRQEISRYREELGRERTEKERQLQEVQRLTIELDHSKQDAAQLSLAVSQKEAELARLQLMFAKQSEELDQAQENINQRSLSVSEGHTPNKEIGSKDSIIAKQADDIAHLKQQILSLETSLAEQETLIAEQELEILDLQNALDQQCSILKEQQSKQLSRSEDCEQLFRQADDALEATVVFEHLVPPLDFGSAQDLVYSERQDRWELEEEETNGWKQLRKLEDISWWRSINGQREQLAKNGYHTSQRLRDLQDIAYKLEWSTPSKSVTQTPRRNSLPAFDDLPDPYSYPLASDTVVSSATASSIIWQNESSGSAKANDFSFLGPNFDSSNTPSISGHHAALAQHFSATNSSGAIAEAERQASAQFPSLFQPKEYQPPMNYLSASPAFVSPQCTAPDSAEVGYANSFGMACAPAILVTQDAGYTVEHSARQPKDDTFFSTPRSTCRTSSSAAIRSSSANPSSAGRLRRDLSPNRRACSIARSHGKVDTEESSKERKKKEKMERKEQERLAKKADHRRGLLDKIKSKLQYS